MGIRLQVLAAIVVRSLHMVHRCWRGARPRALSEREIKSRIGFPYAVRREAWRLRNGGPGTADLPTARRLSWMCKAHLNDIREWLHTGAARLSRRLAAQDLPAWSRRFAPVTGKAARNRALNRTEYVTEAGRLERSKQEAEDRLNAFKTVQGIDREPIEPSHPLLPVAIIFALVTTEAGVSAPLFGRVSDYGDLGGFLMGLALGVLPPILGVLAGFFGIRMLRRKQARFRILGGTIVVTVVGKMSGYGLLIAHLRLVLTAKPSATPADALASIAMSWSSFVGSAEASGLLVISAFAFALGIYEGARRLADPIWGYSALHRRVEEPTAELKALDDRYLERTEEDGHEATAEIDVIKQAGLKEHERAAADAERLVGDHDYAIRISRVTLESCGAVVWLCHGELKDLGWTPGPEPRGLPPPEGHHSGGWEGEVLVIAGDSPSLLLGGILRLQREFRQAAEQARSAIAEEVTAELVGLPSLKRRIAEYARTYLDTPLLRRGPFDPVAGVLT